MIHTQHRIDRYRQRLLAGWALYVAVVIALLLLLTGCASDASQQAKYRAQADAYRVHAAQPRSVSTVEVTGDNVAWSITGATRICISQPIDALPQMDREPTGGEVAVDIIEALVPLAPYAAMVGVARSIDNNHVTDKSTYIEKVVEPEGMVETAVVE